MVTAKKAKDNLEMSFMLMMAGRNDIAQVCLDRVTEYLDSQIEKETHTWELETKIYILPSEEAYLKLGARPKAQASFIAYKEDLLTDSYQQIQIQSFQVVKNRFTGRTGLMSQDLVNQIIQENS